MILLNNNANDDISCDNSISVIVITSNATLNSVRLKVRTGHYVEVIACFANGSNQPPFFVCLFVFTHNGGCLERGIHITKCILYCC